MCLSPSRLKDGSMVACRGCRVCRDNRLNDLVGRCVAEQAVSDATFAVTLTYAGDVPGAVILAYADVQKMLKRLRFDGFNVRYICAGEYGEEKGRAHWHIVLFFRGKVPEVPRDQRINWEYWPHGFSYWQNPDYKGFRYVMKYALKNQDVQGNIKSLAMSKKPPLGYEFFMQLAEDHVRQGLAMHSPEYAFAHVKDRTGRARRYWLQGRMREMYFERYCDLWAEVWGGEPPMTEYLAERYLDPIARKERENDFGDFVASIEARRPARVAVEPLPENFGDDEAFNSPRVDVLGYLAMTCPVLGAIVLAAYADGTFALLGKDGSEWTGENGTGATVEWQLRASGLTHSLVMLACRWLRTKFAALQQNCPIAAE